MTELAESLKRHPCAVLGVPAWASLAELEQKRRDAALFGDERMAEKALEALTHPASRLTAELRWFPGMDLQETEKWVQFAVSGEEGKKAPDYVGDTFLAHFQTVRICLDKLEAEESLDWEMIMKSMLLASQFLLPRQVMEEINRDRLRAGMDVIQSEKDVAEGLDELFREAVDQLAKKMTGFMTGREFGAYALRMSKEYKYRSGQFFHCRMVRIAAERLELMRSKSLGGRAYNL